MLKEGYNVFFMHGSYWYCEIFNRAAFSEKPDNVLIFMFLSERLAPLPSLEADSLHIYVKKEGGKN